MNPFLVAHSERRVSAKRTLTLRVGRLLLMLLLAPAALADITTSAITGHVTIQGAPAAGVTVTVESPALQAPRTTVTGPRGTYWLGALPPGVYDVTFALAGHTTMTRRTVAELARVARSDATLEPSEDEESVTTTATTANATETTALTTHFDDEALDRLPLGRLGNTGLVPDPNSAAIPLVDGLPPFVTELAAGDLVEQVTAIRGAAPAESLSFAGSALGIRTRQGRDEFFFSLRDTILNDSGPRQLLEATSGGRIVRDRLWFFGAGWDGQSAFRSDIRGLNVKLHAQLGAAHHLDGSFTESRRIADHRLFRSETRNLWLQHTAVAGPHFTWETQVARASLDAELLTSRASYVAPTRHGDHVLTAGFTRWTNLSDLRAFFVSDRWSYSRWTVNAGVRHEENAGHGELLPRLSVTYDLRDNGRHALAASYGEYPSYDPGVPSLRMATLGYGMAIGTSGAVRIDVLRRNAGHDPIHSVQLDTRYRLFDRFEAGVTYSYEQDQPFRSHHGNLWLSMELPLGDQEIGVTLLQRRLDLYNPSTGTNSPASSYPTDLALRYTIPLPHFRLTLATDITNALNYGTAPLNLPRELRFWLRARL